MYVHSLLSAQTLTRIQHGAPLQVVDLGETAIDSETFDDYIADLRQHYTADKVRAHVRIYAQANRRPLVPLAWYAHYMFTHSPSNPSQNSIATLSPMMSPDS